MKGINKESKEMRNTLTDLRLTWVSDVQEVEAWQKSEGNDDKDRLLAAGNDEKRVFGIGFDDEDRNRLREQRY